MKKYSLFLITVLIFMGVAYAQVQIKEVEPTKPEKLDIPDLEKMDRLFRISPRFERYEAMKALMENGFNSAESIANCSRKDFLEKAKAADIKEKIAISIHEKATKLIFEKKQKKIAPYHSDKTGEPQKYGENSAKTFLDRPLDEILYYYERMPECCQIELEKDKVEAGEKISINLKDILVSKKNPSQSWHYLFIKVKKGEIKNGTQVGDFKVFEVNDGSIELEYKAPEECKKVEETISVFNSCNIEPDNLGLPESKIATKNFEIICNRWKGTIASTFEMSAQGDQSLVSSVLLSGGKLKGKENWEIDVVLKLDRDNERVQIYKLKSAKIKFQEEVESEIHLQSEHGEVQIDGKDKAQLRGRRLSPSECNLLLIIDRKKKTYKINGTLQVENIPTNGNGRLKVDVGLIQNDHQDTDEGITDISEEILIEGKFSGEEPKVMEGSQDIMKECPPEFQEFMKAVAGKITIKIRWKLSKEGS